MAGATRADAVGVVVAARSQLGTLTQPRGRRNQSRNSNEGAEPERLQLAVSNVRAAAQRRAPPNSRPGPKPPRLRRGERRLALVSWRARSCRCFPIPQPSEVGCAEAVRREGTLPTRSAPSRAAASVFLPAHAPGGQSGTVPMSRMGKQTVPAS